MEEYSKQDIDRIAAFKRERKKAAKLRAAKKEGQKKLNGKSPVQQFDIIAYNALALQANVIRKLKIA